VYQVSWTHASAASTKLVLVAKLVVEGASGGVGLAYHVFEHQVGVAAAQSPRVVASRSAARERPRRSTCVRRAAACSVIAAATGAEEA
jgi:hypothetical protein